MKLAQVPVKAIKPSPHNPRHEAVDIEGLAASIAEVGVIEPLVLSEDPKRRGTYHVTCGSRRLAASKLAGLESVPAVILGTMGEKGERLVSLTENLHRRDMSHIEQGEAFVALMGLGMTQMEVAKATGTTDFTVSNKVALVTRLVPEARDLVHKGTITLTKGVAMARLSEPEQRAILKARPGRRKAATSRTSTIETSLKKAIELFRSGDLAMAYAEGARAVGLIKSRLDDAARSSTSTPAEVKTKPQQLEDLPAGKVRCPHCLKPVRVRLGQSGDDALEEHGTDRPFCRQAIRRLATA